jgi:3-dehydroquinate synthase
MAAGLPYRVPADMKAGSLIARTRVDKKAAGGRVRYILPTRLGDVVLVNDVADELVRAVLIELGAGA